jgi:hypothetical protein
MTTAALAILACLATFAVLSYENNSAVEFVNLESKAPGDVDVLHNLIMLKSYCLAAWDDARIMISQNSGKYSVILDFVQAYGEAGGGVDRGGRAATVQGGNIVSEYGHVVAAMMSKYPRGINAYVMKSIDQAVRHDANGAVHLDTRLHVIGAGGKNGHRIGAAAYLRTKATGLRDQPLIVADIAAKYADFLHFKALQESAAHDADALAATMFLESKSHGHYQSFLQREMAKVARHMRRDFNFVAKSAFGDARKAYKSDYEADRKAFFQHVQVMTPAANKGAQKAIEKLDWTPPNMEEMEKIADQKKEEFMKAYKAKVPDTGALLKDIIESTGGVKVYISTSGVTDAQSTMKPGIKFIGKDGEINGVLRAVPGKENTFVQHFPAKLAIGDVTQVVLTGTGDKEKWNCAGIKVRSGSKDAAVISFKPSETKQANFWVKSGEEVTMVVDENKSKAHKFTKKGCLAFRATAECDANGVRTPEEDMGCTDEVDSMHSGFCKCDSGDVAKVDCGHDTFTCDEMCSE